jgi:DNA-binding LytR/AlgR family response regulator
MLYKIAICDDEETEIEKINSFLQQFSTNTNIEVKISCFSCGEDLLKQYTNEQSPFDIIFLDVEMKGLTGIQTAEKIRAIPDRNVLIVFITSYPEYMQDSFDVQASQYLSKPLSYKLFEEKFKKIISYLSELSTNITVVSLKDGNIVLHLENIVCIETDKSHTLKSNLLVTTTSETLHIKGKIADLEKELQDKHFISLHRSVLANMRYIKRFNTDTVEFINGKKVELSRRKAAEVKDVFSTYTIMRYKR